MHIVDLITKKRDGFALTKEEITYIIKGYTKGIIPDYQMSAFLMAVYFQQMNHEEATYLALAMRDSGDIIDLSAIEGIKVDKHSTGGVGDKVTLILGPLLASLGAKVAKMSGRGLGHTGGTIDKLESIPGYQVEVDIHDFIQQVETLGVAIVGQSGDVAPADKKIYALRDVTATIDSIPLIAASIMSKKLASGTDAICLDVKVGHGAFMKEEKDAEELAKLMVEIGTLAGKKMTAILTGMDEPLGHKIGNGLEVYEAIETLQGKGPQDLVEVTFVIGEQLLMDAGLAKDQSEARKMLEKTIADGSAFNKFAELVAAQGGDTSYLFDKEKLISKKTAFVKASKSGYITDINALDIGKAAGRLGAGRETMADVIYPEVGVDLHVKIGDKVEKDDVIATLYIRDKGVGEAIKLIEHAVIIGKEKKTVTLIKKTIG
ncbi:MAG: pyrimidine-nucleoside phosphorylase [Acholeplasmataceae bacterium]|nr:pyrimidine-nucleoside phosphorylase [Acholeplasmataceae bacterium]